MVSCLTCIYNKCNSILFLVCLINQFIPLGACFSLFRVCISCNMVLEQSHTLASDLRQEICWLVILTKNIQSISECLGSGFMANQSSSAWSVPIGLSAVDEQSSPYLHHFDNPGLLLVSQPLTGDNYPSWNRAMKIALSGKNKLDFIDDSIIKPSEFDLILTNAWKRNNNIVIFCCSIQYPRTYLQVFCSRSLLQTSGMTSGIVFNKAMIPEYFNFEGNWSICVKP